ncbi:MAG TPA: GNAT family N-acetyltransferase [Dehalococcoidia bacterium]|nr:GNAT family N-acetyltransferase [Dehalococcoidia bacterium]
MIVDSPARQMTVTPMRPGEEAAWRDALERSVNGTFYHDPAFSAVHAWKAAQVVNLIFREAGRVIALLTAGVVDDGGGPVLRSPFSASFGGPVLVERLSLRQAIAVVSALEAWARAEGLAQIVLQPPPAIYWRDLDESLEFALRYAGYTVAGTELTYYLGGLGGLHPVVLRNARKATAAGCRVVPTADLDRVWEFLAGVKALRGHPFDLRREDTVRLGEAFPGRVVGFEVRHAGETVAAMLAYLLNERTTLAFHWAQRPEAQHYRPSDLLVLEAARWAFARGARTFDLGTVTLAGQPVWGVARFKEKFRPFAALRRRYAKAIA